MPTSIKYHFVQRFRVPADRAFEWCTDYDPGDPNLMHEPGKRQIEKLARHALLLTDTFTNGKIKTKKTKLVWLQPELLSWTNTQVVGPVKYSQFLYKITPDGENKSRLDFYGLQLEPRDMTPKEARDLARKIRAEDSLAWKYLAKAMEEELGVV